MKRLLALVLCLCFALGGCAQGETAQHIEESGVTPEVTAEQPAATESFEKLAMKLAALPELSAEPDESALWKAMDGLSGEEQSKLWDEYNAQYQEFIDATRELRGTGVDEAYAPAFTAYTLRTAQELLSGATEQNVVYSPANLYLALCMLAETTGGESRAQLLELLGLDSALDARAAANALWRNLYDDSAAGRTLLANSIWLNEQMQVYEDTVDTLADSYYASTFRAPMGDKATDAAIAAWINANTNSLLKDAAASLETDTDTLMMLISTLYFKGTWSKQFDKFNTGEDVFTNAKGEEQRVDFMHKKDEHREYYRGDGFTAASLPFRDGTSMWFLLPDEGVELSDLWQLTGNLPILAIDTSEGCYEIPDFAALVQAGTAEIHWSVPKFDVDSDLDLIPTLQTLGVTDVFDDRADFSALTGLDALVSQVKHAARVKVDEEGCEAAAFTAIMAEATAALVEPQPVIEMNLNRPFGFLITGANGLPLFTGIVNTVQ